ncbi:Tn7-like element transposition protein TnsE [Cytobacillus kochii]|uniref:Tn7-like element transposition protein TnsE n=1 Tax=Cytobacillus kochii TaxID=859143 RepID=UPI00203E4121|nr:Tn7-like element transposition protein TnsE [Cytobacillus kochii]MCM3325008.1 Tn7-like element transposition protein TnsE [Cytobacillus kochii]MCM3347401.1 Tn7-like element transposition protein TnsE [Cytobacillus kochii]
MENRQWRIQAAFVHRNECTIIELPIAALPLLRIGTPYYDGLPMQTQKKGTLFEIKVDNLNNGSVSKAIDVCRSLNYFLYKKLQLMNQNMWSFQSDGVTYHMPQTEMIRALFAINKTLTNALLRPNGLDLLVNKVSINQNQIAMINFSDEIPRTIMTDDFARYFGWLYLHSEMKQSFSSVQSNAYAMMANGINLKGVPLEMTMPHTDAFNLTVRGLRRNDEILILEWLASDLAYPPFKELNIQHKSIKKRLYTPDKRKKRLSKQEQSQEHVLNEINGERSGEDANQPVIDIEPTQMAFRQSTIVNRISEQEQKVNQGDEYISNFGQGGGVKQSIVGLDESIFGGKIAPIEFKTMEIADTYIDYGLDHFIAMIQYLAGYYIYLRVSVNFVYLPLGRKFSYLPDGRRRVCAIVKVNNGMKESFIIEVAVPDNRSLSTLLVPSFGSAHKSEIRIQELLTKLVFNSGSWSNSFLKNLVHNKIRHYDETARNWAQRIINCL